ncbi:RsmB/NOP family class I SAM-dependent RNA methyltransferase [Sphingomonas sanguinis]|uniref:RsmB/NOP family class I SAM-dependent RNA methyltransferase n=1 Tax=Sphingomonas sanguinis TaxID=33051 RepID=A0ABU5LL48_9SPHN|nr:RsmB/NOP family class I SAM-dependent RNA methyltransferase [Sphingomonas sanguinis]MDZ7280642.1 RsmB/NOP family class I SAM-dependent RNA methyltransferase [Sphingomonas sanguinis]QXT36282.1 RsmB/NOP family class I SAM-dependent RNA methyltransferase [Sphingomonas sanguinis]
MTPAARTQAAIELLDEIVAAAASGGAAADTLIARYFATRRYAGSKDRRAVRELVYAAIRQAGPVPSSGRAAMLAVADRDPAIAATFDGTGHGPAPMTSDEPRAAAGVAPSWLVEALKASGLDATQQAALVERAPLDIRVNSLATTRAAVLEQWPDAVPTPHAPMGLRLPNGTPIEQSDPYRAGLVEVQDEGSQLVGAALAAKPGEWIVDLCAGAGGKTLQLAAAMNNQGALLACDIDRARLQRLAPRAERAGATIIESRLLNPGCEVEMLSDWSGKADGVLIDAPCSGTGTWRRNPEARWRLTPERLARLGMMQTEVLEIGAGLVKPGGRLVYIVCSLLDAEGTDQVAAFLSRHSGWSAEPVDPAIGVPHGFGQRLDPATHGTDGFFVACLRAPC